MVENKQLYIVDASVLIKWFIQEIEDKNQALKFKRDYINEEIEIGMPTSCLYETFNTIARKAPGSATLILSQILIMGIEEYELTLENSSTTIEILEKSPKISFYDAIYHSIAIRNKGIFLTADEKYYNQAKSLKHIQLLKDYK